MESTSTKKYVKILSVLAVVGLFAYGVHASKFFTYFTEDPKVCVNCHTMNTQYAAWEHSSHRERATCVECHLPQDSFVAKYMAKSKDGFNHTYAMTFRTYEGRSIDASPSAQKRIQANCITCHKEMVSQMTANAQLYMKEGKTGQIGRKCWSCHRYVPHGRARGLDAAPDALGVKEI